MVNKCSSIVNRAFLLLLLISLPFGTATAATTDFTSKGAKELFDRVYDLVFGKRGSSLSYSVNIIGLYKTKGDIVYKDGKVRYSESRYCAWEDGVTAYMVDKKKQTVDIYRADDDKKDEYLAKFKYDVRNFDFSYRVKGDYYELKATVKNSHYFGIREAVVVMHKSNLHPVSLVIKLAFIKTTVKISNFKAGGIDDKSFVFPKSSFLNYKFTDHRKE